MRYTDDDITEDVGLDFLSKVISCPLCHGEQVQIVAIRAFPGPQDESSDGIKYSMRDGLIFSYSRKENQTFRPNPSVKLDFYCQTSECEFSIYFSENHGMTALNVLGA